MHVAYVHKYTDTRTCMCRQIQTSPCKVKCVNLCILNTYAFCVPAVGAADVDESRDVAVSSKTMCLATSKAAVVA